MSHDGSDGAGRAHADSHGSRVTLDPDPIEVEFEPAGPSEPESNAGRARAPRQRSRNASYRDLIIASLVSGGLGAAGGATLAIAVTSASSGASTGTLAQELTGLSAAHTALAARNDQLAGDVVTLRARLDSQAEAQSRSNRSDAALRLELTALTGQMSALAGLGGGSPVSGTLASDSPVGVLLARLNRLETIISDDAAAPATTRQMQRATLDLAARVAALDASQAQFASALQRRQLSLDALENGLDAALVEIAGMREQLDNPAARVMAGAAPGGARQAMAAASTTFIAAEESRAIRALSALEAAASGGAPFLSQQQTLATLLPADADVRGLEAVARTGAPPAEAIRSEFNTAARAAERITAGSQPDGWNWLRGALSGASIAKANPSQIAARLIAARGALEMGDVRAALEAVRPLDGLAGAAFATWTARATVRADLDAAIEAVNARLVMRPEPQSAMTPLPVASQPIRVRPAAARPASPQPAPSPAAAPPPTSALPDAAPAIAEPTEG